jgi:hypothetical protein
VQFNVEQGMVDVNGVHFRKACSRIGAHSDRSYCIESVDMQCTFLVTNVRPLIQLASGKSTQSFKSPVSDRGRLKRAKSMISIGWMEIGCANLEINTTYSTSISEDPAARKRGVI